MTARTATVIGNNVGTLQFGENVKELKSLIFETANTVDATNTIAVTYANYGITTVHAIRGWKHTTDKSVVVEENPTTALSSGVFTITVPAGTDNDKRIYQLWYS